jgi:hypothetical protein
MRTFSQQVLHQGRDLLLQSRLLVLQSPPYVYLRPSLVGIEHAECTFSVHDFAASAAAAVPVAAVAAAVAALLGLPF